MSSTESSGAPAEASATTPASFADVSFGSTRGSGLARGKAKRSSAPAASTAASSDYTPTAIEIVTAPREYQNPFASAETESPAQAVAPVPVATEPAPVAPVVTAAPAPKPAPAAPVPEAATVAEEAELNILPPAAQKSAPAQTWESEGFKPTRSERSQVERPRRDERSERTPRETAEPVDISSIPAKFLYVRPGYNYVPTPSNYGGAPRENRAPRNESASAPAAMPVATPEKSGGFFGWLKSLFGGTEAPAVPTSRGEVNSRTGDRPQHRSTRGRSEGQRRHRGGRNRHRSERQSQGDQAGSSAS